METKHLQWPLDGLALDSLSDEQLFVIFGNALFSLHQSLDVTIPPPVLLWLMVLYHVVAYSEPSPEDWQSVWLGNAISLTRAHTWPQARGILKAVMWVDFVHDEPGGKTFETAIQRPERPETI